MIVSLPITPRKNMPIGYWLTPVLMDVLAKQRGEAARVFLGTLGLGATSPEAVDDFIHTASMLSITATVEIDTSIRTELEAAMKQLLDAATASERLGVRSVEAYVCDCGALEIPVETVRFLREKTFKREGDSVVCKKCNEHAHIQTIEKLFFSFSAKTFSTFFQSVGLAPSFYIKELENLAQQIEEFGIGISKTRETGFQYNDYNIDVEFLLLHVCAIVPEQGTLVVTNHVLRQALIATLIACELQEQKVSELLILPYLEHLGDKEKWKIHRLLELGHDAHTIRFMLAHSLRWQQKTCTLEASISQVEYRRFVLLQKHLESHVPQQPVTIEGFIQAVNHEKCTRALKAVFAESPFDYSLLYGL